MIGLSLSLCIRDIIEGKVGSNFVEKIIADTFYTDREMFYNGMKTTYCLTYWKKRPALAHQIAMRLWDEGRIHQLRETHPGVLEGHWIT